MENKHEPHRHSFTPLISVSADTDGEINADSLIHYVLSCLLS